MDIHYIRLPKYLRYRWVYAVGMSIKLFSIRIKRIISKEETRRLVKLRLGMPADIGIYESIAPDPVFAPLDAFLQSAVKQALANESEYFICTANFHNAASFIFLLKAFSILKKRLRTGIKLMLTGIHPDTHPHLFKQIRKYRYRPDLILLHPDIGYDYASLLGSAYAQIYPSKDLFYASGKWDAVKMHIPVILPKNDFQEDATGAFLYFEKDTVEDLADKMMLLYKDEMLRKNMILSADRLLERWLSENDALQQIDAILKREAS